MGKDTSVYENAFLDAIDSGKYTIVVTQSNYGLSDLCIKYAPEYKDIKFISFDMGASADISAIDNMFGIAFKQNEGSFLVGALAGKLTTTNKIGVFLFNDVPVGNDFATGYIAEAVLRKAFMPSAWTAICGLFTRLPKMRILPTLSSLLCRRRLTKPLFTPWIVM